MQECPPLSAIPTAESITLEEAIRLWATDRRNYNFCRIKDSNLIRAVRERDAAQGARQ
jgi:hypothetical protein